VSGADIFRRFKIFFTLLVIVPVPILGARYGPLTKMIISVRVNGHPANLIVDTRANQIILDAGAAESFGISSSHHGLRYIGFTQING
jgi:hypothetical protein